MSLNAAIAPEVPRYILGDTARLRQILVNLIGNAAKFTFSGSINIRVTRESADANGRSFLLFSVADTGLGIPPDKLEVLFKPFSQVDSSSTRKQGGTGLGLAISKNLVELMGGRIWVESSPVTGSVFSFTIPTELVPQIYPVRPVAPAPNAGGSLTVNKALGTPLNILLVEDVKMNRVLALKMLNMLGYTADTAENGCEAIAAVKSKLYDLVFMDLYMPEMDGFSATREIRRMGVAQGLPGKPYICALTANVMPKDQQACLEAGMNDILTKPLRLDALRAALDKALQNIRSRV